MQQLPPKPLLTLYRPSRAGGRWVARADIDSAGERIELQATASDSLAGRAAGWYNRAAEMIGRYVKLDGLEPAEASQGVFSDMPQIATAVATSPLAIPSHPDITAAARLYQAAASGVSGAIQQIERIVTDAPRVTDAAEALSDLQVVQCAHMDRERLPMARIFQGAANGDTDAIKVLAALRAITPGDTMRLSWDLDDWQRESPLILCGDVISACADEIGARLVRPTRWQHVRQIKPLEGVMLSTYQAILAAYGG